jgi:hypothetical protein
MNKSEYDAMLARQVDYLQQAWDRYNAARRRGGSAPTEISVSDLAREIGMRPNTLYRLMRGENLVNLWNLITLSRSPWIGAEIFRALLSDEEWKSIEGVVDSLPEPQRDAAEAHAEP